MNKLFKFIILLLALTAAAFGQITSSGTVASGVNLISSTPVQINSIQLFDTSGAANTITLYDNDSASSTNRVRQAYTITTQYSTNVVMSFTNFTGVVQSYTNTVLATVNTTVAAATNQARRVFTFTLPANGTVTFTPTYPQGTTYGLQLKATGAGVYNANIQPLP